MNNVTTLTRVMPDGSRWTMNEIKFGSRFHSLPWTSRQGVSMSDPETQLRAARELKEGWERAGPWPEAKFEIAQNGEVVL